MNLVLFLCMNSCSGGKGGSAVTLEAYTPNATNLTEDLVVEDKA